MTAGDQQSGEQYVLATSAMVAEKSRTVKHANTFAVFDSHGDIHRSASGDQGIYHNGTRFLSDYQFYLQGERPMLLSSDISQDNHMITVDLANPDLLTAKGARKIDRGEVHIFRSKFLWQGRCYEKYRIRNFGLAPLVFDISIRFGSDFADIFEVRGMSRARKGQFNTAVVKESVVELPYQGLDGVSRRTRLEFSIKPDKLNDHEAIKRICLDVDQEIIFEVIVSCLYDHEAQAQSGSYPAAYQESSKLLQMARGRECEIDSTNENFNMLINRATSDLRMLLTQQDGHLYPYAGIPWFCTPFGRDGLITALETLWFNADISRGVLNYLAAQQATEVNALQDAEPGKILHEIRMGEMTNAGELPFAKYYGSADATPLFIILAGKYLERSGDIDFARKIWPHVERGLGWIAEFGDRDGDGFVEYERQSEHGLENQSWKDASDSVFHQDGALAKAPIAICEVQGYVFAAKKGAAYLAEHLGMRERAQLLQHEASELKKRFEQTFWDSELGGYILALDKDKKPCRVKASNMGHCLYSRIASPRRAGIVADTLMGDAFFSGWGIRTLAQGQPRFNPMSYHNGSVWPHDNAMIAEGFANYGFKHEAGRILEAMCQMSQFTELNRFPELFCGFRKRPNQGPTLYPVACSPQAWSAAGIFSLLRSCLGFSIDALDRQIRFFKPYLPGNLGTVTIRHMPIGEGEIDFEAVRHENDVSIHVIRRTSGISVMINK